ncbi:terminase small subunit [Thalassospira sp.]|uniref:terminase small subunit n=1 Tax=Thalassospira sp. TaxID=1912094 RepID=UPI000C5EEAAF|nr:terminase small subunit [Thalassospira sp.]MAL41400.1 terminase [Thalassospira sp.]
MKLTGKQQRFVEEYLIDQNATQAAIRAGYSEKTAHATGHENLKKPEIAKALEKEQAERTKRTRADQDWVITRLMSIAERSMQAEKVTDRSGNPVLVQTEVGDIVPAYTFNAAGANKALELLGRNLGMFTDKTELSGPDGGPMTVNVVRFSDDDNASE